MNVIALKEKAEGILQKEVEDTSFEDVAPLMEYMAYLNHEIFLNKKLINAVNNLFTCVINFKRPPVINVESDKLMSTFRDKVYQLDGNEPYYKADGVDVYEVADRIEFIKEYGYFVQIREKDGTLTGYEWTKIDTGDRNFKRISHQIWHAIHCMNLLPRIFHYKGQIIRLLFVDGHPKIQFPNKFEMRHVLDTVADYFKIVKGKEKADSPNADICEQILSTPDPPLPVLEQIKQKPYFAADGELIVMPGYSEKTRCFLHDPKNITGPKFIRRLSIDDAKRLLLEVLGNFPFVSESDKAHAVALFLQSFVRQMIKGPTPIFMVDAPTPGTGKTLLIQALTYIATGKHIELQAMPNQDDEMRKRITSKLMSLPTHFVFDNVRRKVDSAELSLAVTANTVEDRIMGKSKNVIVPVRCTWIVNGNNIKCSEEIARRSVRIRLDAGIERPWQRSNFKHQDLMEFIINNLDRLVWAGIDLVANWIKKGKPKFSGKLLGKFESCSEITGGILEAAGIPGFLEDLDDFYDDVDEDTNLLKALVFLWHEKYGVQPVKASDLTSLEIPIDDSRKMGGFLKANKGKTIGDFTIKKGKDIHKTSSWYLEKGDSMKSGDHKNVIPMK